jgi:hypothetical protein
MMTVTIRPYRRYLLGLVGGLLLFFGARWSFQRDRPERLREIPVNGAELFAIREGVAYVRTKENNQPRLVGRADTTGIMYPHMLPSLEPLVVQTLPVTGGPASRIGEHRLSNIVFRRIQFTDDALYYVAYSEARTRPYGWEVNIPGTTYKTFMGVSLTHATLHALPRTGGDPVALLPGKELSITPDIYDGEPIAVVGDKIYWIEIDPKQNLHNTSARLRVVTKQGGEPKTLMTSLSPRANLSIDKGQEGVLWLFAPPVNEISNARKIYRLDSADDKPKLFLSNRENHIHLSRPVTLDGRVYWKRNTYSVPIQETEDHRTEILSSALDGSDTRVHYTFLTTAVPSQFYFHTGRLYFNVYKGKEGQSSHYGTTLMQLEPEASSPAREVFRFPTMVSQIFLDGGFVYYTQEEERGQTRPNGSGGSFPVYARVLCRYRLPR